MLVTGAHLDEAETVTEERRDNSQDVSYYMVPASGSHLSKDVEPLDYTHCWLDHGLWSMGKATPHRTSFKPGDKICFNVKGHGVSATATVAGEATRVLPDSEIPTCAAMPNDHDDVYGVPLTNVTWLGTPIVIDVTVRRTLDAFKGRSVTGRSWAWLVQTSRTITPHDYAVLTGQIKPEGTTIGEHDEYQ